MTNRDLLAEVVGAFLTFTELLHLSVHSIFLSTNQRRQRFAMMTFTAVILKLFYIFESTRQTNYDQSSPCV